MDSNGGTDGFVTVMASSAHHRVKSSVELEPGVVRLGKGKAPMPERRNAIADIVWNSSAEMMRQARLHIIGGHGANATRVHVLTS